MLKRKRPAGTAITSAADKPLTLSLIPNAVVAGWTPATAGIAPRQIHEHKAVRAQHPADLIEHLDQSGDERGRRVLQADLSVNTIVAELKVGGRCANKLHAL